MQAAAPAAASLVSGALVTAALSCTGTMPCENLASHSVSNIWGPLPPRSQTFAPWIHFSMSWSSVDTRVCSAVARTLSWRWRRKFLARPSTTMEPSMAPSMDVPFGGGDPRMRSGSAAACTYVCSWNRCCMNCFAISTRYDASVFRFQSTMEPGKTSTRTTTRSSSQMRAMFTASAPGTVKSRARQMLKTSTREMMTSTATAVNKMTRGETCRQLRRRLQARRHIENMPKMRLSTIASSPNHIPMPSCSLLI
mmetsp:Transcript_101256/g.287112  ORF Transcript_101256/g.287112 Transcript_101256/m.287112 type:complete len:252 (-) Transcript_101256:23-778(-)